MKRFFWVAILSLFGVLFSFGSVNAALVGESGVTFEKQYERAKKEGCKAFYQAGLGRVSNPSRDSQECEKVLSRKDKSNGKVISSADQWLLTKCTAYAKVDPSRGNITTSTDNSKKCLEESKKQGFSASNTVDAQDQVKKNTQLGTQNQVEEGDSGDETECAVQYFGWVVCPGTRIGTGLVVGIYGMIAKNLLEVKSDKLFISEPTTAGADDQSMSAYNYWQVFRNIANVLLAIIMAVIVFSQVSNIGISNYSIKKMLPRLIIFAIIINISFWLVAGLVDLMNIVGWWIFDFLGGSGGWHAEGTIEGNVDDILRGKSNIVGAETSTVFTVAIAGVAAVTVFGVSIITLLLLAVLALFLMFIILTSRQAVIIMLVVVSPIAFASAILPNTEGFYNKWKGFLKSMLIIYPVCSMMIGGLVLTSNVLYDQAQNDGNVFFQVIYGLLPMVGLFATYAVIKGALSLVDKLTGGTGTLSGLIKNFEKGGKGIAKNNRFSKAEKAVWDRGGLGIAKAFDGAMNSKFMTGKSITGLGIRKGLRGIRNAGIVADIKHKAFENEQEIRQENQAIARYQERQAKLRAEGKDLSDTEKADYANLIQKRNKRRSDEVSASAENIKSQTADVSEYKNMLVRAIREGRDKDAEAILRAANGDHRVGFGARKEINQAMIDNLTAASATGSMASLVRAAQTDLSGNFKDVDATMGKSLSALANGKEDFRDSTLDLRNGDPQQKTAAALSIYQEAFSNMSNQDLVKQGDLTTYMETIKSLSGPDLQKEIDRAKTIMHADNESLRQGMNGPNLEIIDKISKMDSKAEFDPSLKSAQEEKEFEELKKDLAERLKRKQINQAEYDERLRVAQQLANEAAKIRLYQDAVAKQGASEAQARKHLQNKDYAQAKTSQDESDAYKKQAEFWNNQQF